MAQRIDYTLKPDAVTVIQYDPKTGVPTFFPLTSGHPTFNSIVRALKRKEWHRVPKLVNLAAAVADRSAGDVEVKKEGIYYRGVLIHNSLTQRTIEIMQEGKPVGAMLKFMDNLYKNPEPFAIEELYDWLRACKLPITDDGCFVAYKRVDRDLRDCFTHKIDNSPGQLVFMRREDVCRDRTRTCEQGLHFCSVAYLPNYPGDRVVKLKVNPKDVVSIPNDYGFTKGRTWMYEVLDEAPADQLKYIDMREDIEEFRCAVYSIASDQRKLLRDILALPTVRRMIRRYERLARKGVEPRRGRKAKDAEFVMSERNIRKMTYGRLVGLYKRFSPPTPVAMTDLGENRLADLRAGYQLSRGQVAQEMGVTYGSVYYAETAREVPQETVDAYIKAVSKLAHVGPTHRSGLSIPAAPKPAEAVGQEA